MTNSNTIAFSLSVLAFWVASSVQSFQPTLGNSLTQHQHQLLLHDKQQSNPPFHITRKASRDPWTRLFGKKAARKGGGGGGGNKPRGQQQQQEKQSVKDQRFDAATRQFMFTMVGLTKMLPDKSKNILKDIHLSFYPGAKIGVVGLNGSGTCARELC